MHHVVFCEPAFVKRHYNIWALRGGHKYKSILGDLGSKARVTVLMSSLPPETDPHRRALEEEFDINFAKLNSLELQNPYFAELHIQDLTTSLTELAPTIISNLNGRNVGFSYAMAMAAEAVGAPFVWRLGGNDLEARGEKSERTLTPYWGTRSYYDRAVQERIAVHLSRRLIVMSEREHTRVASMTAEPSKVAVCVRGVEQTRFCPGPDYMPTRCRRFLFLGRRSLEKGYDILEAAMQLLTTRRPDITATFAGTFEVGAAANRRYIGFIEHADLPALYRAHDALVVCSRSEGFPQVIMEAMSCGLPCILTRALFAKEFTDGEQCLLSDPLAEEVAAAMTRLHDDEELYQRLAASSLATARNRFSEEENRRRYHDLLLGE